MKSPKESVFLVYQAEHIALAESYIRMYPETEILATSFWLEQELKRRNVTYISAEKFVPQNDDLNILLSKAETIAREWYRHGSMKFFSIEKVSIGEALEPAIDSYLQLFLYVTHLLLELAKSHPDLNDLIVPASSNTTPSTGGPCTFYENHVYEIAAKQFEELKTVRVTLLNEKSDSQIAIFPSPSPFRKIALRLYNSLWILVPRKKHRIYASEYWSHIAPVFSLMSDTELFLMDRKEIASISLKDIFRLRIRLVHPLDYRDSNIRKAAKEMQESFRKEWISAGKAISMMPIFNFYEGNVWNKIDPLLTFIVTEYAERVISDAMVFKDVWSTYHIDKVLLRASVGIHQPHFFIASQLAPHLGIPSIELQHAIEVIDPATVHSRLAASYLASYGINTREALVRSHGYNRERILSIGSPRFDTYSRSKKIDIANERLIRNIKDQSLVIFVAIPGEVVSLHSSNFDSYSLVRFLREMRELKNVLPNSFLIFKVRPGYLHTGLIAFVKNVFSDEEVFITETEDPYLLMRMSDVIITGNSTLVSEALIAERATLIYPVQPHDIYFASQFKNMAHAPVSLVDLIEQVRELIDPMTRMARIQSASSYLKKLYSFDGKASERMAEVLISPLPAIEAIS